MYPYKFLAREYAETNESIISHFVSALMFQMHLNMFHCDFQTDLKLS